MAKDKEYTATKDRLLADSKRRRTGDFYTPLIWVDEAHKLLEKEIGNNWREDYMVWDCAAGSANLTRDYSFEELYLSTLYLEDVELIKDQGLNNNASIFQFDFLNDPLPCDGLYGNLLQLPERLPSKLLESLTDQKKIVFLVNPPYGTASAGVAQGANKSGVSSTRVGDRMSFGVATHQLYTQFMFRITDICHSFGLEAFFGLYSSPLFMTSTSFESFREFFYKNWKYRNGFMFCADEFSGTSKKWGVSFTLWETGRETRKVLDIQVKTRKNDLITKIGEKKLYYPEKPASNWVKEPENRWRGVGVDNRPKLSSAINVQQDGRGILPQDALGAFFNGCNNIGTTRNNVVLMSAPYSGNSNVAIFPENFDRVVSLYTARKVVKENWINQKDEFCVPDMAHPSYSQFVADSHVFCLFNTSNHCSSLREVSYKGKDYDIKNEFFWQSAQEMRRLAELYEYEGMLQDLEKDSQDRHMYLQLTSLDLSKDAQELIEFSKILIQKSMKIREEISENNPEFHLDSWDAGWYQVFRGILRTHFPEETSKFLSLHKKLGTRLEQETYVLGFLKK